MDEVLRWARRRGAPHAVMVVIYLPDEKSVDEIVASLQQRRGVRHPQAQRQRRSTGPLVEGLYAVVERWLVRRFIERGQPGNQSFRKAFGVRQHHANKNITPNSTSPFSLVDRRGLDRRVRRSSTSNWDCRRNDRALRHRPNTGTGELTAATFDGPRQTT